ncbi:MAG: hypothetical protein AB8H80_06575 [Planctomycetota bacterium]
MTRRSAIVSLALSCPLLPSLAGAFAAIGMGAALVSQTYIVDAASGPGTSFTSLAVATSTAPDGATLLVRPGIYTDFLIDQKSLTIVADLGTTIDGPTATCRIANLLASQQVVVRGLDLTSQFASVAMFLTDNAGRIIIDTCKAVHTAQTHPAGNFTIQNCRDVRLTNVQIQPAGGAALRCIDSHVRVASCDFRTSTDDALYAENCYVECAAASVEGGASLNNTAPIGLVGSQLRLLKSCSLTTASQGVLIRGTGSARIDPSLVASYGGSTPYGPGVAVANAVMPGLTAATGPLGATADAEMSGPPTAFGAIFLALPGPLLSIPSITNDVAFALGTEVALVSGALTTPLAASYTVPINPGIIGLTVTWQGVALDANGLRLSNGVSYTHY